MSESDQQPDKKSRLRFIKYLLPPLFLLIGFFGVQIWMILDTKAMEDSENALSILTEGSAAKAQVKNISAGNGDGGTPIATGTISASGGAADVEEQSAYARYPAIVCYFIEAGSFKDKGAAQSLQGKLSEMGYSGYVKESEAEFDVILMGFFSKEQANNQKAALLEKGVSASIEKYDVSSSMVMLQGKSKRLQALLDGRFSEVPDLLRELCDNYYLYETRGFDVKEHSALAVSQLAKIGDMKSAAGNMDIGKEDQGRQTEIREFLKAYSAYLEAIKNEKTLNRGSIWPGLIELTLDASKLGRE